MSRVLREEKAVDGTRCKYDPYSRIGFVWSNALEEFTYANTDQYIDYAATFTALRTAPYVVDAVVEAIKSELRQWLVSITYEGRDNQQCAETIAARIRPLLRAEAVREATVEEICREVSRRGVGQDMYIVGKECYVIPMVNIRTATPERAR